MRKLRISLEVLVAVLFLCFAGVQWNDPDPFLWMLVYALASTLLVVDALDRGHWALPGGLSVLTLGASGVLATRYDTLLPWIEQEFMREAAGLALVALTMGLVAVGGFRRSR